MQLNRRRAWSGLVVGIVLVLVCACGGEYIRDVKKDGNVSVLEQLEAANRRIAELEAELEKVRATTDNYLCAYSCGKVCIGRPNWQCFDECYIECTNGTTPRNTINGAGSVLGSFFRRDAIHHVGLTVSNLTRSVEWYTEVLGGVLVNDAGGDGWMGDDVFQLLMQKEQLDAKNRGETFPEEKIALLQNNGTDVLAARYINFGALQIELLDYRARPGETSGLPYYHHSSAPSQVNNMHIALYLNDDADLNQFVAYVETESEKRGFDVRCNRVIAVSSEAERERLRDLLVYNSYIVKSGPFEGWALAYCKGPDGEQLEFNQAFDKAKAVFDEALVEYVTHK